MAPARRYPVEPLARRLGIVLGQPGRPDDETLHGTTLLAHHLGITPRQAKRLVADGLTENQADRAAIRIGLHPALIWVTWWAVEYTVDEDAPDWFTDDPPLDEVAG